jgi:methionyl-tRNA formyltransferase
VIVIAGNRPWIARILAEAGDPLPQWQFIGTREELGVDRLAELDPSHVFFLHWSWMIPAEIFERWECVVFHMTDLPYGRGGSPLQNLIARGHTETVMSAIRVVEETDAGPVYMKRPLSLTGSAQDIYERATRLSLEMIADIMRDSPEPQPQVGEPVQFTRRRPEESELPADISLEEAFDHIRMLDAEGYPHAFVNHGDLRLELTGASFDGDELNARVAIRKRADKP